MGSTWFGYRNEIKKNTDEKLTKHNRLPNPFNANIGIKIEK